MTRLDLPSMPYAGPCACCGGPGGRLKRRHHDLRL